MGDWGCVEGGVMQFGYLARIRPRLRYAAAYTAVFNPITG